MRCPKCNSEELVRDGFLKGRQRYLCKSCKYRHSVQEIGKPASLKRQALILYLEGLGFRSIGRLLGVSNVSVLNWIRKYGEKLEEIKFEKEPVEVLEMDELHSYVESKKSIVGSGWLLIGIGRESSTSSWVAVGQRQVGSFGTGFKEQDPSK